MLMLLHQDSKAELFMLLPALPATAILVAPSEGILKHWISMGDRQRTQVEVTAQQGIRLTVGFLLLHFSYSEGI